MPTGVAIREVRAKLFDAAERILLRAGPNALTSRAVTTEAGVAKGVLHRHFDDFDAFLAELVADRIARFDRQSAALCELAGTGTVVDHLTDALLDLFGSVALSIVALIIARDELRRRLRRDHPHGIPVFNEGAAMITAYLAAERERGRVAADADVDNVALMLIGTAHLVFAGRDGVPPERAAVREVVTTAIAGIT